MDRSRLYEIAGTVVLSLVGCAHLVACGGGDDGEAGDRADAADPAPTVTVSPSEGQQGVLVDQPLILTFSKPMNTASVEAAWSSSSLPAADLEFSWNTSSTILTVDASAVLAYPAG